MQTKLIQRRQSIGSGAVIVAACLFVALAMLCFGQWFGWDATWRSFGVTPLQPHFFDMHAITDHVECASKDFNVYDLTPCDPTTKFNYPPVWLWLRYLAIDGSDSAWISVVMTIAAFGAIVTLFKGRSVGDGVLASVAILSPSVMMGVERGNTDQGVLGLVCCAALIFDGRKPSRVFLTVALVGLAVVLKLYPLFCVTLAARANRRTFIFAGALVFVSFLYFVIILDYLPIIRLNTPITFMLSYGYKVPFLGLDHLRDEAGLRPIGLTNTWVPIALALITIIFAAAVATTSARHRRALCVIADSAAGTAFLFGAGIYCGSFMLGTNFIYRLMFLLLCLPQLQDWSSVKPTGNDQTSQMGRVVLAVILLALWLNGNPNGHSTFLFVPPILDWLIFFGLTAIILFNFLKTTMYRAAFG